MAAERETGAIGPIFDFDGRILVVRSGPRFTSEDLRDAFQQAVADERFQAPMWLLFDNRGSKESAPMNEIRARVEFVEGMARLGSIGKKVAVVVDSTLHYALARQGEGFSNPEALEIRVFRGVDEAREWLNRDE